MTDKHQFVRECRRVKLSDICVKGKSSLRQKDIANNGPYAVYGASGIIGSTNSFQNAKPYVAVVKDGAGVGRANACNAKTSVLGTMQALIPKEGVDCRYLLHLMRSMRLGKNFSGSTIPHIYFRDYGKTLVPFPDMTGQRQIVEVLDVIEKQKLAATKQIDWLDSLVRSRFVEMFGNPRNNSRRLPVAKLSELGQLERGRSKHRPRNDPRLLGGPYPLVQTGDIAKAGLYLTKFNETYSEFGLQQSRLWPKGTMCITIAANIAKTAILKFDACFPDSVVGFTPNEKVLDVYMYYWFDFFQGVLESQAPQAAQKNINLRILSNLDVSLPSMAEQKIFADFVAQVDKSRFVAQQQIEKLQMLYDSLAQEYFGE